LILHPEIHEQSIYSEKTYLIIKIAKFPLYAVMTRLTPLALGGDKRGKNGYYQVRSLVLPNVKRVEVF